MTCSKCAALMPDDAKFCASCGASTQSQSTVSETPLMSAVTPVTPVPPANLAAPVAPVLIDSGKHAATQWLRLVNYFIDNIGAWIFGLVLSPLVTFSIIGPSNLDNPEFLVENMGAFIGAVLISSLAYPLYYIFFEGIWQRTPGKWASGTKVVMLDGSKPGIGRIIGRSFARYIPFEAFSYLFGKYPYGWHDALTKTTVVPVSYTATDIQAIDVHDKGKGSVWMIVLAFVALLLPIIAIIGILSSVVLASLNTARVKGNDAFVKATLVNVVGMNELYYDAENSYKDVCKNENASTMVMSLASKNVDFVCNDSVDAWAATANLSDTSIWCVDSTGYRGLRTGELGSDLSCEKGLMGGEVEWFTYTSPLDGFSVDFPQEPLVSVEKDVPLGFDGLTMDQSFYEAQDEMSYYSIAKIVYSASLMESEPKDILESMVSSAIDTNPSNKLISSKHITYMGDPAIEFVSAVEGAFFSGRYIITDEDTVYSLLFGYEESSYDAETYERFVNSFKK